MTVACLLGCDWQRTDLISALRTLGYLVVGVDRSHTNHENVDEFILESLAPIDLQLAARRISGAIHRQSSSGAHFPVLVDNELGLPLAMALAPDEFGPFRNLFLLDKVRQYQFFAAAGVGIPRWKIVANGSNLPASWYFDGQKVVVKPRFGWAACGVFSPLPNEVLQGDVIVQEAIDGDVVVLVLWIDKGHAPRILGVVRHGRTFGSVRPGHSAVSIPASEELNSLAAAVTEALGVFRGVLQIEAIVDSSGGTHLLEVTPTLPGFMVRRLLGIELRRSNADGLVGFGAMPQQGVVRAAAWLYPDALNVYDSRVAEIRAVSQSFPGAEVIWAPRSSFIFQASSDSRPLGVVVASANSEELAVKQLGEVVFSAWLDLDGKSTFGTKALGLADIL